MSDIDELLAELDALGSPAAEAMPDGERLTQLVRAAHKAATLITSLREALEPFAKAAEAIPDTNASDNQVHYSPARLTVADFRRASTALNPSRKETGI